MIRINKPTAPEVLRTRGVAAAQALCAAHDASPEAYRKGTKRFDADFNRAIYAAPAVKDALLAAQHGKCAFCESQVRHVSFGDVEHFRPKGGYRQAAKDRLRRPGYFWLVYTWENLFFSCQMCNQMYKGNLFPRRNPS
jgi:hypothetical protein